MLSTASERPLWPLLTRVAIASSVAVFAASWFEQYLRNGRNA